MDDAAYGMPCVLSTNPVACRCTCCERGSSGLRVTQKMSAQPAAYRCLTTFEPWLPVAPNTTAAGRSLVGIAAMIVTRTAQEMERVHSITDPSFYHEGRITRALW
jgi:hypothetical protein